MVDKREMKLAEKIVGYSCNVKKGEKVLIEYSDCNISFVNCLVKEVLKKGAYPFVKNLNKTINKVLLENGNKCLFEHMANFDVEVMKNMDAVVLVRGSNNIFECAEVSKKNIKDYESIYTQLVHMKTRLNKKWVTLRWPTSAFAQSANMSTESFENFFFDVCNLDYSKMNKALTALQKLMMETDRVKIVAKDTCLEFSIKGMSAVKCCGEKNIPDGEIYTAPVKQSINGHITFNVPAMYNGVKHENIKLAFENGKIVSAHSSFNEEFENILETDEGSRYIGEFAFGVNPFITKPINDILFDEKMCHSIHMAIGNSYEDAFNGNLSAVHLDLIQLQTKEMGGGEIYFDDVLIRKDGLFIVSNLVALNPQNLV